LTLKRAITHPKPHHADEVFATAILRELYPDIEIVRTRDKAVIAAADPKQDIVYDVGLGKYDHHQNDKEYRDEVPYAAFGLIWRDFGSYLLRFRYPDASKELLSELHTKIDRTLVQGIDGPDNGLKMARDSRLQDLSSMISDFNRNDPADPGSDHAFMRAVAAATGVLDNKIVAQMDVLLAKQAVLDAFNNREQPQLLILPQWTRWEGHLLDIDTAKEVLFVIFPGTTDDFRIQVVPAKEEGEFDCRKSLPAAWAGLHEELGELVGIPDAVFCHSARFIAAAKSYESIMKMADLALQEDAS
jgi:uncharacterized UPF0160 family protein